MSRQSRVLFQLSLCELRVFCVSVVNLYESAHHKVTEHTKDAQNSSLLVHNLFGHVADDWQFELLALIGFDGSEDQPYETDHRYQPHDQPNQPDEQTSEPADAATACCRGRRCSADHK